MQTAIAALRVVTPRVTLLLLGATLCMTSLPASSASLPPRLTHNATLHGDVGFVAPPTDVVRSVTFPAGGLLADCAVLCGLEDGGCGWFSLTSAGMCEWGSEPPINTKPMLGARAGLVSPQVIINKYILCERVSNLRIPVSFLSNFDRLASSHPNPRALYD